MAWERLGTSVFRRKMPSRRLEKEADKPDPPNADYPITRGKNALKSKEKGIIGDKDPPLVASKKDKDKGPRQRNTLMSP